MDSRRAMCLNKLKGFSVVRRLGKSKRAKNGYYGCNAAVFLVHPVDDPQAELCAKVIYNTQQVPTSDLAAEMGVEYSILEDDQRLPVHTNILHILAHFVDTASPATLGPSWDFDFDAGSTLFLIMEIMETTLQSVIGNRRALSPNLGVLGRLWDSEADYGRLRFCLGELWRPRPNMGSITAKIAMPTRFFTWTPNW